MLQLEMLKIYRDLEMFKIFNLKREKMFNIRLQEGKADHVTFGKQTDRSSPSRTYP